MDRKLILASFQQTTFISTSCCVLSRFYGIDFFLVVSSVGLNHLVPDWCGSFTETVHTAWGKPCVSDSRTPYQGRCLRLLCRQLLAVRSLQGKRKYISIKPNTFLERSAKYCLYIKPCGLYLCLKYTIYIICLFQD